MKLSEMADSYRETCIRLRLALEDIETALRTAPKNEKALLQERRKALLHALTQARDLRQLCESYYTSPRNRTYTSNGWTAPKVDGLKKTDEKEWRW